MSSLILDIRNQLGGFFKFTQVEQVGPLMSKIVGILIVIAGLLFLIYFLWSGLRWLTSGGEKTAVAAAKARMTAAFIGFLLVLASWAIYILIRHMFGIQVAAPGKPAAPGGKQDYVDCCPIAGTSAECCDYMQSFGDSYVINRYQNDPKNCDQLYINWGLWRKDWHKNVGPEHADEDKCAPSR